MGRKLKLIDDIYGYRTISKGASELLQSLFFFHGLGCVCDIFEALPSR
jgi:hypothetical protein